MYINAAKTPAVFPQQDNKTTTKPNIRTLPKELFIISANN